MLKMVENGLVTELPFGTQLGFPVAGVFDEQTHGPFIDGFHGAIRSEEMEHVVIDSFRILEGGILANRGQLQLEDMTESHFFGRRGGKLVEAVFRQRVIAEFPRLGKRSELLANPALAFTGTWVFEVQVHEKRPLLHSFDVGFARDRGPFG